MGGNLGNREKTLSEARKMIGKEIGEIMKVSSIYETEAWGFITDQPFLNQVILVETEYSAVHTLKLLLSLEKELGRKRTSNSYDSRVIDLDILFYNETIISSEQLNLPHPRLHQRQFTLVPLNEIASQKIHPVYNERICRLMEECLDPSKVRVFKPMKTND